MSAANTLTRTRPDMCSKIVRWAQSPGGKRVILLFSEGVHTDSISSKTFGAILQPQPAPWEYWVRATRPSLPADYEILESSIIIIVHLCKAKARSLKD
jgi:hypothetical protein